MTVREPNAPVREKDTVPDGAVPEVPSTPCAGGDAQHWRQLLSRAPFSLRVWDTLQDIGEEHLGMAQSLLWDFWRRKQR